MSHVTSLQLTIITCTAPLQPLLLLLLLLPPVQAPQQMLFPFVEIACRLISDFYAPREIAHHRQHSSANSHHENCSTSARAHCS